MSNINFKSIEDKARAFCKSNDGSKRVTNAITSKITEGGSKNLLTNASADFMTTLRNQINSSSISGGKSVADGGLGSGAISALSQLTASKPQAYGRGRFAIDISFSGDLTRHSLVGDKYEDIRNLAALLNNGYDANKSVFGLWHGNRIRSLQHREGAHFIDEAVRTFEADYGNKYNIIDIEVNDIYKQT